MSNIVGIIIWHFSTRLLQLPSLIGTALLVLYWTSPSIFLAGNIFRSAKYGAALMAVVLYVLLYKTLNGTPATNRSQTIRSWSALFFTAWIGTLFDRQGVFIVGMALCFVVYWRFAYRKDETKRPLTALLASWVVCYIYTKWIATGLTRSLNHYEPNGDIQRIPWRNLWDYPITFYDGLGLLVDTVRFMLGNIPFAVTFIALIALVYVLIKARFEARGIAVSERKPEILGVGLMICVLFLLVGLNTIMATMHQLLTFPDIKRVYYWVPQVAILFPTLAFGIYRLRSVKNMATPCTVLLALAIAGNIIALPRHDLIVREGHLRGYFEAAPQLLEALRNLDNQDFHPSPTVLHDPVYQFLRNEFLRRNVQS